MSRRLASTEQLDRPRSLAVELLPAGEALDFEYVASRLHDRALLRAAVAVRIFRAPLLAVPVGGCRLGGRLNAGPVTIALAVHGVLCGRDGFPQLRIVEGARGEGWYVEWGALGPGHLGRSREALRFFGYAGTGPACRVPEQRDRGAAATVSGGADHLRGADNAEVSGRVHG